ncbi:MAG: DNA primase [Bacteroidales bacterium]|jgi:DNA primase, catalytic core|nr:DNA primase [Bacteroidales bacterium]
MVDKVTIERIMDAANIVDVIGDFVALKRRGSDYIACCPFHNEKTPSFSVSPRLGIYKCFGCGKAGNVVNFVMEHEQMTYVEALKYLGKKYGIEVKEREETAEDVEKRRHGDSLLIINEYAQKYFTTTLLETEEGKAVGLSYFKERGFSEQTIKDFLLGYADRERNSFSSQAIKSGYKKEYLTETGLALEGRVSENGEQNYDGDLYHHSGGELYDRFRERVMFPIRGITGRVVAFGGRKLRGDKNIAKYVNSPESSVYIKNKTLYGLYEAKAAIAKAQNCYLVEGYTDVISFHQNGVVNVVASCGTSLTQGQILLIKRFSPKVTVLYDGDAAGIHASLRGIDLFLAEGLEVKVALFPDGEDPDSYARKHTPDELQKFLKDAEEDFISFKYRILSKDIERDPLKRAKLIGEVVTSISVIPDSIVRSVYIDETAKNLKISPDILNQKVAELRAKRQNDEYWRNKKQEDLQNAETGEPEPEEMNISSPIREEENLARNNNYCKEAEQDLIYYLLKFGHNILKNEKSFNYGSEETDRQSVAEYIKTQLDCDGLELINPVLRQIYNEYFTLDATDSTEIVRHFAAGPDNEVAKVVINLFQDKYSLRSEKIKNTLIPEKSILGNLVPKAMYIYKAKVVAQRILELTPKLDKTHKEGNTEEEKNIVEQIKLLTQVKKNLTKAAKLIDT